MDPVLLLFSAASLLAVTVRSQGSCPPFNPLVNCPADCGVKKGRNGCSECDCDNVGSMFGPPCPTPVRCRAGCGLRIADDGCAKCDCFKKPFDSDCPSKCPASCGAQRMHNGCLDCICDGLGPFREEPFRPAATRNCPRQCPQDCGMEFDSNGCARCSCNVNPFFSRQK